MKDIIEFLEIDCQKLKTYQGKILLLGTDLYQQFMLLRFVDRQVNIAGFLNENECSRRGLTLLNKKIYNFTDVINDNSNYLVIILGEDKCNHDLYKADNIKVLNIYYPRKKCIIYGAGYYGKECFCLFYKLGIKVIAFCDRNHKMTKRKYLGYDVISPHDMKHKYKKIPIIIALDVFASNEALSDLSDDKLSMDYYIYYPKCDVLMGFELSKLHRLGGDKKIIIWGSGDKLKTQIIAFCFGGYNVYYGIDYSNLYGCDIVLCGGKKIEIKSPYDLCYEDYNNVMVIADQKDTKKLTDFCMENDIDQSVIVFAYAQNYRHKQCLDPNLGYNLLYGDEVGIVSINKTKEAGTVIGVLGGSTSDITFSYEKSWVEQLVEVTGGEIKILNGAVCGYNIGQELIKFVRDMSYRKLDILISYSGYNDVYFAVTNKTDNLFIHPYQYYLFEMLYKMDDGHRECVNVLQGITDYAEHWLHYEHILYTLCKELGIIFYAIFQPSLYTKKNILDREYKFILEEGYSKYNQMKLGMNHMQEYVKKQCCAYSWLIDFSDLFDDTDECVYIDACHLNTYGNNILSRKIYDLIKKDLQY